MGWIAKVHTDWSQIEQMLWELPRPLGVICLSGSGMAYQDISELMLQTQLSAEYDVVAASEDITFEGAYNMNALSQSIFDGVDCVFVNFRGEVNVNSEAQRAVANRLRVVGAISIAVIIVALPQELVERDLMDCTEEEIIMRNIDMKLRTQTHLSEVELLAISEPAR